MKQILLFVCLLLLCWQGLRAQNIHPVQVTTQLLPPYSVYLADYAQPGNEKLRLILVQKDLSKPLYQLRLVMRIELNGKVMMQTSRSYQPAPISLEPGVPTIISGADLAPYLESSHLDFVGYDRNQYERTKALPEGAYTLCFTAYDYRRQEVPVSNAGCSFYFLAKNEPPLLNLPACDSRASFREVQQVIFSWLPRNTASPTSAQNTEYTFELFEVRIPGRNPNDIVLTTPPIYTTTTDYTQLVYGVAEPPLLEGMAYVWRVQAKDKAGKDAFRNRGYSQVCTFTYGGVDPNFQVGVVQGLRVETPNHRTARMHWMADAKQFDGYRVEYKRNGEGYEWMKAEVKDSSRLNVFDLEADTDYEVRVQGQKRGVYGAASPIVAFHTPKRKLVACGDAANSNALAQGDPMLGVFPGVTITARDLELILTEVKPGAGPGWYDGKGRVLVPFLAGASFEVVFQGIFINVNREVTRGSIYFVTRPLTQWADEQVANQQAQQEAKAKEQQQRANQEKYAGVDFEADIVLYDAVAIGAIQVLPDGKVEITDAGGTTYLARESEIPTTLTKPLIIEDKNGDQWVLQTDKTTGKTTAEKVPGGGLPPASKNQVADTKALVDAKSLSSFGKFVYQIVEQLKTAQDEVVEKEKATVLDLLSQGNTSLEKLQKQIKPAPVQASIRPAIRHATETQQLDEAETIALEEITEIQKTELYTLLETQKQLILTSEKLNKALQQQHTLADWQKQNGFTTLEQSLLKKLQMSWGQAEISNPSSRPTATSEVKNMLETMLNETDK